MVDEKSSCLYNKGFDFEFIGKGGKKKVMFKVRQLILFFFAIAAVLLLMDHGLQAGSRQSLKYNESRGEKVGTRHFYVEDNGKGVAISSSMAGSHALTRCDDFGNTRQWVVNKNKMNIRAIREGNTIQVTGRSGDKAVDKRLTVGDGLPWFQSLYYALSRFVQGEQKQVEFWMIRPDNLSLVKLRAEKESVAIIRLNGSEERTQKVKLSATGLLKYIWHGYYWYRKEDGVLLQYKDMKALPGRAKLTMHLTRATHARF